ncbi:G-type lectin S-receptor-like serine/threonine-protein kinase LECRK1 [Neltuma alba]|uniref:G-type lectin S-receptor-like serine/threonine-protein kinase LECRK1 n=1 Tax=Neltuma alba TaxID=207710 RepID=UPI0010A48FE9|nr:G-type lectin S-receptor-like serine/threonine-protein kinase LECRK1 [Prosopis alba]
MALLLEYGSWVNQKEPSFGHQTRIELTKEGLLLRNEKQKEVVIANASEPAVSASMLDSGNFVLYSKNHSVLWQSFVYPTDTILGGQNLSEGQNLTSANGHFTLNMQSDGNLVAYPGNNEREDDAYWHSNTSELSASQLTLNLTGFLCLSYYGDTIKVLANGNYLGRTTSLIYRATLDLDGIFRLYVHTLEKNNTGFTSHLLWEAISDRCQVKGFCGLNSYCSIVAGKAECKCYLGFKPISGNNSMFLVCDQTMKNDCITSRDPRMLYNVSSPLQHMQWSLVPYWNMQLEMEACGKSCQEDCDCGAVLHEDGSCKKYKLPLAFGRINNTVSTTALFKVPSMNAIHPKKARGCC